MIEPTNTNRLREATVDFVAFQVKTSVVPFSGTGINCIPTVQDARVVERDHFAELQAVANRVTRLANSTTD